MNKIVLFFKSPLGKIILALVLLGIGFLGGMEYKAYQIRTAIGDVFTGISDAFAGDTSVKKADDSESGATSELTKKVGFEVTEKSFSSKDYQDLNTFTFKFTNTTNKNIEGFEGDIVIRDLFGNVIKEAEISYDEGIKAGESLPYNAWLDYNQFMDEDVKLKQTDLSKLRFDWQVTTIIYEDGTKEVTGL